MILRSSFYVYFVFRLNLSVYSVW